mgnify:FL=1
MLEMRKMKDSGIEWIGEIPEGWSIARGKHILTLLQRAVFPTDGVITCFRDGEVTLRSNRREDGFTVSLKEIGYQGIEPGDLVVHGMDGFAGSIGISDSRGKSSPVLVVLDSLQDKKYLMYYLRSMAYNNVFLALSTGIRVRSCDLKWNKLADLLYLVPPIVEQHKLVSFLDEKCSEIDAMLSKTRASIEEYKKLKQAVITQAVTKGVRGEREMKDSGVDYIGQIPAEWVLGKLRNVGDTQNGISKSSEFFGKGFPFVSYSDVYKNYSLPSTVSGLVDSTSEEQKRYSVKKGDIFFTRTSETIEEVGFSCVCEKDIPNATFAGFLIRVRPFSDKLYTPYAKYYFRSSHLRFYLVKEMNLVTRASLGQSLLKSMPVLLPPLEEQKEIADYLDTKYAEIDGLIAKKDQLVKELESYKKSLIYEVVTGKREV